MSRARGSTFRELLLLGAMVSVLVLANLLPPDTSLRELRRIGVMRACVPVEYRPLVTGDASAPGIDIELLSAIAQELDLRLSLNRVTGMGRDFNPRNWRVTRAHCQILAGGVVASPSTRTYLETTSPYLLTGWAVMAPNRLGSLEGAVVGFYSGTSGLDRIALGRYLRDNRAQPVTVSTANELVEGLQGGGFDVGVSEALLIRQLAGDNDWDASWLPQDLGRYPLAFGLWKGDVTFKRAVDGALKTIVDSGRLDAILARYELEPLGED